jgi:membrane protein
MKKIYKKFSHLLKATFSRWSDDRVSSMAAALAYYTIFSLAPFLFICIQIAGLFLGADYARAEVIHQLREVLGKDAAQQILQMVTAIDPYQTNFLILSIILLFGATGVFIQLQDGLN